MKYLFILLTLINTGCINNTVHANTPLCAPEFFRPFNDSIEETSDYLWFATDQACSTDVQQDESYTLLHSHSVQQIIIQMGSNAGSLFEWDLLVTFTRPDGRNFSIQQQYDKHIDNVGNKQVVYSYSPPQYFPAGTIVNLHRRSTTCVKAGPWGNGMNCATGQSVQLVGTLEK